MTKVKKEDGALKHQERRVPSNHQKDCHGRKAAASGSSEATHLGLAVRWPGTLANQGGAGEVVAREGRGSRLHPAGHS